MEEATFQRTGFGVNLQCLGKGTQGARTLDPLGEEGQYGSGRIG